MTYRYTGEAIALTEGPSSTASPTSARISGALRRARPQWDVTVGAERPSHRS